MKRPGPAGSPGGIRALFNGIAGRYRLMNRIMTFGRDRAWRRAVVAEAGLSPGQRLLDVAVGTGDIALEAHRSIPGLSVTGVDFAEAMMQVGRRRRGGPALMWCAADALALPFPERTFDAVTSGYLMRNVSDPEAAFREQLRVLRPGGTAVCLDTSPPPDTFLRPLVRFHLHAVIPLLGRIVTGDRAAYSYLSASTEGFKAPGELAAVMERAGYVEVRYRLFMFGTIAVHIGRRKAE